MESLLLVLILLPIVGAFFSYKWEKTASLFLLAELALVVILTISAPLTLDLSGILVSGLHLHLDGFQAVYALLASAAWFLSSLFSKEYGQHMHSRGRYYAFMLLTLAGTVGVFMSTHLMTTWICFEFMSFSSYVLVAQEEDDGALKAAGSYMTYGTIGGLAILMGLWMLHRHTGTLEIASLAAACESLSFADLLPAGLCMLAGFGAKAGMFPLHTWLPAAHPVAPAPASALLSGVIVKTGIYGIAVVTVHMFSSSANHVLWGNLLLIFSVITMVVGGLLALFSVNLKRTLACSSMSQMGFVIFGLACTSLLGHHGSMAASGAVLHMVNHTLFKQVLFTLAGIVMLRTGSLLLNDVRGFGKGKPLLLIAYLCAALGIGGIPLLSGYVSKTLLHESLVHYMHSAHSVWYSAAEWLFLFSGGLTVAYMIKLFVVLFVDRPAEGAAWAGTAKTATETGRKPYMTRTTAFALLTPAVLLPIMGMFPHQTMDRIANLSMHFFHAEHLEEVAYFAWMNLKGGLISITIGLLLYFVVVRRFLMKDGQYVDRWPKLLDMERFLYIPVLMKGLPLVLGTLCRLICDFPDKLFAFLPRFFGGLFRIICDLPDLLILLLRRTFYREVRSHASPIAHHRVAYFLGSLSDRARENVEGISDDPAKQHETAIAFARNSEAFSRTTRQIFGNLSFSLIMACIGIGLTLVYIVIKWLG